jgi:hypothetical protein
MDLNRLLSKIGIDTNTTKVLVLRHAPGEPKFRKLLPHLAAQRRDLFDAYQQFQRPRTQTQFTKASYIVSCIGDKPGDGDARFIGLYKVTGRHPCSFQDFWKIPENEELKDLGMKEWDTVREYPSPDPYRFDLDPINTCREWGKFVLNWPGSGRSWSRWADRDDKFLVTLIT